MHHVAVTSSVMLPYSALYFAFASYCSYALLLSIQTCKGKMHATQKLILLFFLIRLIIVDPERNLNVDTSTIKINFIILHSVIAQTEIKVLIEPQILPQIYTSTFKVREVSP